MIEAPCKKNETCRSQDRADMKEEAEGCCIERATQSDYIHTRMSKQVTNNVM
jgi:hypothetical protein